MYTPTLQNVLDQMIEEAETELLVIEEAIIKHQVNIYKALISRQFRKVDRDAELLQNSRIELNKAKNSRSLLFSYRDHLIELRNQIANDKSIAQALEDEFNRLER